MVSFFLITKDWIAEDIRRGGIRCSVVIILDRVSKSFTARSSKEAIQLPRDVELVIISRQGPDWAKYQHE